MSRKGNCWDNAVSESFFGTLEQELISRKDWNDEEDARTDIGDYIHSFYNATRIHSSIGHLSPNEVEQAYYARKVAA